MILKNPSAILILSFLIVTGYLIRENWNLVPHMNVIQVVEETAPDSHASHPTVEKPSSESTSLFEESEAQQELIAEPIFEAFLDEISERLPTKNQIRYLSAAEVHGHPRILLETALDFGQLAERLESNITLRPKGLEFYKGCALNNELVNSVRAVCFYHAQVLEIDLHARIWETQPGQIPPTVIDLAKTL